MSTWEGIGGPIRMDHASMEGIDPTLDACCRREVSEHYVLLRAHSLALYSRLIDFVG